MKLSFSKFHLSRILLFIAAIVVISYFIPEHTRKAKYVCEINKPWAYDKVVAQFDMPIPLDSATFQFRQDSINNAIFQVFRRDDATIDSIMQSVENNIANYSHATSTEKTLLLNGLHQLLNDGVLTNVEDIMQHSDGIYLVDGNVAERYPATKIHTAKSARAYIDSINAIPDNLISESNLSVLLSGCNSLKPDSSMLKDLRHHAYASHLAPNGLVQKGEKIIDKGEIVTERARALISEQQHRLDASSNQESILDRYSLLAQIAVLIVVFTSIYIYMGKFRWKTFLNFRHTLFIVILITIFTIVILNTIRLFPNYIYVVPFTMVPILITVFLDARTALFMYVHLVILCAVIASLPIDFVFLQMCAGLVAIYSIGDLSDRWQFFRCILFVFLTYSVTYCTYEIIYTNSIGYIALSKLGHYSINIALLCIAYVLMDTIERIFGFTSNVSLIELANINNELLQALQEKAPGTYEHSSRVATLAYIAAKTIHANAQLVRTAAYYHDIGKINNPEAFIENQHGFNPLDGMDKEQKAKVLIGHVSDGIELATKARLPHVIIELIAQHHGNDCHGLYKFACKEVEGTGKVIDPTPYKYPGPTPSSKEAALLMISDSVEAATSSLKVKSVENISNMVSRVIWGKIDSGQLNNAPISLRDINTVRELFIERLAKIYQSERIEYPDTNNEK